MDARVEPAHDEREAAELYFGCSFSAAELMQ